MLNKWLRIRFIFKIYVTFLLILILPLVFASPKTEICNALNVNGTECDNIWNNISGIFLNYTNYTSLNVTVQYYTEEYEYEYRNYSYFNCTNCNCTFVSNQTNWTMNDTYSRSYLNDIFLTKSDFESKRLKGNFGDYIQKSEADSYLNGTLVKHEYDIPTGWKVVIVIFGIFSIIGLVALGWMTIGGGE